MINGGIDSEEQMINGGINSEDLRINKPKLIHYSERRDQSFLHAQDK